MIRKCTTTDVSTDFLVAEVQRCSPVSPSSQFNYAGGQANVREAVMIIHPLHNYAM